MSGHFVWCDPPNCDPPVHVSRTVTLKTLGNRPVELRLRRWAGVDTQVVVLVEPFFSTTLDKLRLALAELESLMQPRVPVEPGGGS